MKRIAIRERAMILLDMLAEFHGNVYDYETGRTFDELQLPAVQVKWGEEELNDEDQQQHNGEQMFNVPLMLDVTAQDKQGLIEFIDLTIYRVRQIFKVDPLFQNNAMGSYYLGTTEAETSIMGQLPVTNFIISIQVMYAE